MMSASKRTWAQIDLDCVKHNFNIVKAHTKAKICCVVKANAYGHGAVKLAALYQKLGADFLAVSNIDEALQLRNSNIVLPILILGYTPPECAKELYDNNISQAVYSSEYANALLSHAGKLGVKIKVHIKIDSGMGRIGFQCIKSELDSVIEICKNTLVIPEGIFTHFSVADEGTKGKDYTSMQFQKFASSIDYLSDAGIKFSIRHCANSATILDYPEYHMDMVRAGVILYGLSPSHELRNTLDLHKVMELKSVISHIKTIEPGTAISYGKSFVSSHKCRVATIPIGYADGFWRSNGDARFSVKIKNRYAPVLGRVCMDQMMVDVTDIECVMGDEVLIFGSDEKCSADQIADVNNSINYEVVCSVGERVPRIFVKDGELVD